MKYRTLTFFAAVLACTGLSHAQTAASASGVINGLSYHLVDLNPTDGITPWVKFSDIAGSADGSGQFFVRTLHSNSAEPPDLKQQTNSLFNGASGSFGNAEGTQTISVSGNQLSTSVTTSLSDLTNPSNLNVPATGGLMYYSNASFFGNVRDVFSISNVDWQLSPNTKLVIDGVIDLKAAADASLLNGTAMAQLLTSADKGLHLSANALVSLSLSADGDYNYASYYRNAYAHSTLGKAPGYEYSGVPGSLVENIQLAMSNASDSALTGRFSYSFGSSTTLTLTPVTYVPEPGTWVLMGLGLMGVAAANRRAPQA